MSRGLVNGEVALRDLIEAAWGGYDRPDTDSAILEAIAGWMDRLDDVADGLAGEPVVRRQMQADLRRIAITLVPAAAPDRGTAS